MVRNLTPLEVIRLLNDRYYSTCSDLTVEKTCFGPTQSGGKVPKVPPLSEGRHPDLQSINSVSPPYSEWDGTNHTQSLGSTIATSSITKHLDILTTEDRLPFVPPINKNDADPEIVNTNSQDQSTYERPLAYPRRLHVIKTHAPLLTSRF